MRCSECNGDFSDAKLLAAHICPADNAYIELNVAQPPLGMPYEQIAPNAGGIAPAKDRLGILTPENRRLPRVAPEEPDPDVYWDGESF